jgi:hypothetical protein
MQAAKNTALTVSTSKVALDFLKLTVVSVASALIFATTAGAVVILLSGGV